MQVACVLGSPRPGSNSSAIAKRFCDTAAALGATIETFVLNKLTYRGCQACMVCKTKLDRCVLDDDLKAVLEAVRAADIVVLASPVYYGDLSAQLKGFIDRTYSYLVPDYISREDRSRLPHGKTLVMILTQGNPDESIFGDIFPKYSNFLRWEGIEESHLIRGCGLQGEDAVAGQPDLLREAEALAGKLCRP
ncbi:MAG: flavodoxin family protein [Syntrophobacteraceae bacterium]